MTQTASSTGSRALALGVLCTGQLMIILDQTIVNVALPSIQSDLDFTQSNLAWVVNSYLIAFGGLLLLSGRLGDLIGRKQIFVVGLTVFTVASLLCGLATSQEFLGVVSLGFAAPLMAKFGPRNVLMAGLSLIAVGLAVLSRAPADGNYVTDVLPVMLLLGTGFGAMMPALMTIAMSDASPSDSGLASGLFNTTQQVGGALTLAVLATLAAARTNRLLDSGEDQASAQPRRQSPTAR